MLQAFCKVQWQLLLQYNSANLIAVSWGFHFVFACDIQVMIFRQHGEIQSCHSGWWIRETSPLSLACLGVINLSYHLLKIKKLWKILFVVLLCFPRAEHTHFSRQLLASCSLRSHLDTQVLTKSAVWSKASASYCVVCAWPTSKAKKPWDLV